MGQCFFFWPLREFNSWDSVFLFRGKGLNSHNASNCREMCVLYAMLNWLRYGLAYVESVGYSFRNIIDEYMERCLRFGRCWWLMLVFSWGMCDGTIFAFCFRMSRKTRRKRKTRLRLSRQQKRRLGGWQNEDHFTDCDSWNKSLFLLLYNSFTKSSAPCPGTCVQMLGNITECIGYLRHLQRFF